MNNINSNIKSAIQFEQDLYNLINHSGLQLETAFYILKSVYIDFQNTLNDCLKTEGEYQEHNESIQTVNEDELKEMNFKYEQPIDADASEYSGSINDN